MRSGERVLEKGHRLNSHDVGILASLNCHTVKVYKKPTVSIISTGDELVDIHDMVGINQIRNGNAYMLSSEVTKYGGIPHYLGITRDALPEMKELFLKALQSDVVISTGGVSRGRYDYIKQVFLDLDIIVEFEGVSMRPGRPFTFGRSGHRLVFSLPGSPLSALTCFTQFVRPALLGLMGAKRLKKPIIYAFLKEDIVKKPGGVHLVRGYFTIKNNEVFVCKAGEQASPTFRSMSKANCLIIIPDNASEVRAGEKVAIQLIDHDEI